MRTLLLVVLLSLRAAPALGQHEFNVFAEPNTTFGVGVATWRGPLGAGLAVAGLGPGGTSEADFALLLDPGLALPLELLRDRIGRPRRERQPCGSAPTDPDLLAWRGSADARSRAGATVCGAPVPPPLGGPDPLLPPNWEVRTGVRIALGSAPRSGTAAAILDSGATHLGVRYVWGGARPDAGFDCSGFVQVGIRRPWHRATAGLSRPGSGSRALPLDRRKFRPGDLLFFASNRRVIDHVAIYAGDGRLLHATEAGGRVQYDQLAGWFADHLVAARRVF